MADTATLTTSTFGLGHELNPIPKDAHLVFVGDEVDDAALIYGVLNRCAEAPRSANVLPVLRPEERPSERRVNEAKTAFWGPFGEYLHGKKKFRVNVWAPAAAAGDRAVAAMHPEYQCPEEGNVVVFLTAATRGLDLTGFLNRARPTKGKLVVITYGGHFNMTSYGEQLLAWFLANPDVEWHDLSAYTFTNQDFMLEKQFAAEVVEGLDHGFALSSNPPSKYVADMDPELVSMMQTLQEEFNEAHVDAGRLFGSAIGAHCPKFTELATTAFNEVMLACGTKDKFFRHVREKLPDAEQLRVGVRHIKLISTIANNWEILPAIDEELVQHCAGFTPEATVFIAMAVTKKVGMVFTSPPPADYLLLALFTPLHLERITGAPRVKAMGRGIALEVCDPVCAGRYTNVRIHQYRLKGHTDDTPEKVVESILGCLARV